MCKITTHSLNGFSVFFISDVDKLSPKFLNCKVSHYSSILKKILKISSKKIFHSNDWPPFMSMQKFDWSLTLLYVHAAMGLCIWTCMRVPACVHKNVLVCICSIVCLYVWAVEITLRTLFIPDISSVSYIGNILIRRRLCWPPRAIMKTPRPQDLFDPDICSWGTID